MTFQEKIEIQKYLVYEFKRIFPCIKSKNKESYIVQLAEHRFKVTVFKGLLEQAAYYSTVIFDLILKVLNQNKSGFINFSRKEIYNLYRESRNSEDFICLLFNAKNMNELSGIFTKVSKLTRLRKSPGTVQKVNFFYFIISLIILITLGSLPDKDLYIKSSFVIFRAILFLSAV